MTDFLFDFAIIERQSRWQNLRQWRC